MGTVALTAYGAKVYASEFLVGQRHLGRNYRLEHNGLLPHNFFWEDVRWREDNNPSFAMWHPWMTKIIRKEELIMEQWTLIEIPDIPNIPSVCPMIPVNPATPPTPPNAIPEPSTIILMSIALIIMLWGKGFCNA